MILQVIFSVVIILCTHFYYKHVYLLKQKMKAYKSAFQRAGFSVKLKEPKLFSSTIMTEYLNNQIISGDPFTSLKKDYSKYDVMIESIMDIPHLNILSAPLLQAYFNTKITTYPKFKPLTDSLVRIMGNGIIFSEGEGWKKKRRVISQSFHFEFLNSLIDDISQITKKQFEQAEKAGKGHMNMLHISENITANVIVQLFFGSDMEGKLIEGESVAVCISELVGEAFERGFQSLPLIFGAKVLTLGLTQRDRKSNHRAKLYRQFVHDTVRTKVEHLKTRDFIAFPPKDLIEQLYKSNSISSTNKSTEETFNYEQLINEFASFFIAGSQTTSRVFTMATVCLNRFPQTKLKLEQEISTYIKTDADITLENMNKMLYLKAVLKQTIRMYSPAMMMFTREVAEDHELLNVKISKGTLIQPVFGPMNYNPQFYPNPEIFQPQRWLDQNKTLPHPFTFTPFSSGMRNCIGQHLAQIQGQIMLIRFVRDYNFNIENPEQIKMRLKFLYEPEPFNTIVTRKKE